MRARVAIVGGGVMGAAVAWQTALRLDPLREPVVLLERSELAAGSSGRSGAVLRQHYARRELAGMARDSLRVYAGFHVRTGYHVGFRRCGVLTLAGPDRPEDLERLRRNVAMQRSIGIETELVEAPAIRALAPGIEVADGTLGAHEPGGGFVDPRRTVEAFAALARFHGASTRLACAATRLRVEDGRVRGLETAEGPVEAEQVVVAAGPWSRALLADAGVELPLQPVRTEQQFFALPPPPPGLKQDEPLDEVLEGPQAEVEARFAAAEPERRPFAHPVLLDLERGYYTRCEPLRGRTRVGALDYAAKAALDDPDALDERVDPEFTRWARAALAGRLPVYREQPDAGAEAAVYTLTPDLQAAIGPVRDVAGLFVVSGFSGHGFKLAPSVGEGVAQMLLGEPVSAFDTAFFDPARFADGRAHDTGAFGL